MSLCLCLCDWNITRSVCEKCHQPPIINIFLCERNTTIIYRSHDIYRCLVMKRFFFSYFPSRIYQTVPILHPCEFMCPFSLHIITDNRRQSRRCFAGRQTVRARFGSRRYRVRQRTGVYSAEEWTQHRRHGMSVFVIVHVSVVTFVLLYVLALMTMFFLLYELGIVHVDDLCLLYPWCISMHFNAACL